MVLTLTFIVAWLWAWGGLFVALDYVVTHQGKPGSLDFLVLFLFWPIIIPIIGALGLYMELRSHGK